MRHLLRAFAVVSFALLGGLLGCSSSAPVTKLPVRVLHTDPPAAPLPDLEPHAPVDQTGAGETQQYVAPAQGTRTRIGAPGGSGAGSRRVAPPTAQSGNETVGGRPAGTGANGLGAGRG